jgi:EmrB/QacA subfamily drug resistance transporter
MTVPYKWLVATAFISGLFMDLTDATIVNVALPTLSHDFGASIDTLEWVVTGYLVSLAVWIPASGWIGDRFGTKKTFAFALAMFTATSALCGLAWSTDSLITFRILQGIGGGMMTPVGTTMLFRAFPKSERAKAAAVITIPTAIAPALGPVLGGWLVDHASWRWIFYVNVPVGLAALIFTLVFLREHKEPAGAFDVWGFLSSAGGLALVLFALSRAPRSGWTSPQVLLAGLTGIALFVVLVMIELHEQAPILHLRLFEDRMFRAANLAMFMVTAMLLGVLFLLPLFLQQLRGLSAFVSGLTTAPQALGLLLMSTVSSRLYPRIGPRRMLAVALGGIMITSVLFLLVDLTTSLWWIRGIMFLRGVFMSLAFVASQAATFSTISAEETGRASALFNTNRQVAASLGVAILATVLSQEMQAHHSLGATPAAVQSAELLAFHAAFAASIAFGLLGIVFALRIPDEDAIQPAYTQG